MVEISNFGLQKSYIPQKTAENLYKTDSARKSKILYKKNIFFNFFDFSRHARGPPKIFKVHFSKNFKKKFQKWLLWDLSIVEQNKVMSFGESSPEPVETADGFMVGGAIMAPPTMNLSAVSTGSGLGSPKLMTLFLSIIERSKRSHFWNFFLKIFEN